MECPVCLKPYDVLERRPKGLPCGHSLCRRCLEGLQPPRRCPECRADVAVPTEDVPDNYGLVRILEQRGAERVAAPALKWCLDCVCVAGEVCRQDHPSLGVGAALRRQLQDAVPRVGQDLDELLQACGEEQAAAGLQLLSGPPNVREPSETPPAAADEAPNTAGQIIPEMNLWSVSTKEVPHPEKEEEEALQRVRERGVRRLAGLFCNYDPEWSLSLLRSASPSVEELEAYNVGGDQLAVVHAMPRLRRLHLLQGDPARLAAAPELPPLHRRSTLQHLSVWGWRGLPPRTLVSLLRGCGSSLTELQLTVGTAGNEPWPRCFNDLPAVLAECNLLALRWLLLMRGITAHTAKACSQQTAALRRVLPECVVKCHKCDDVLWKDF